MLDLGLGLKIGQPGSQFGVNPIAAFYDDFERANEALEASSAKWSLIAGSAAGASVLNGKLSCDTTNTAPGSMYFAPDCGVADQFIQIDLDTVANTGGPVAAFRGVDESNYLGIRNTTDSLQLIRVVAGGFTFIGGSSGLVAGDILQVKAVGDQLNVYRNGVLAIGPITETAFQTATRYGVIARFVAVQPWLRSFAGGPL